MRQMTEQQTEQLRAVARSLARKHWPEMVDDGEQEALASAFKVWNSGRLTAPFHGCTTYLYAVMRNRILDAAASARRKQAREVLPGDAFAFMADRCPDESFRELFHRLRAQEVAEIAARISPFAADIVRMMLEPDEEMARIAAASRSKASPWPVPLSAVAKRLGRPHCAVWAEMNKVVQAVREAA